MSIKVETILKVSEVFDPLRCYGDTTSGIDHELRPNDFENEEQMGFLRGAFERGERVFVTKAGGFMRYRLTPSEQQFLQEATASREGSS